MARSQKFADDQVEEMIKRLEEGATITSLDADPRMPSMRTILNWEEAQDDLGCRITQARARGYTARAEKIVEKAATADDPVKARLAFDAERWFLGKMCPKKFGDAVQVKHADADGEKLPIDPATAAVRIAGLIQGALARDADGDA